MNPLVLLADMIQQALTLLLGFSGNDGVLGVPKFSPSGREFCSVIKLSQLQLKRGLDIRRWAPPAGAAA